MGGGEGCLDVVEEVALLPSSVTNEIGVDIVGVLSGPTDESFVGVRHGGELELADDAHHRDSRLGHDELVGQGVVTLAQLSHTQVPACSVGVSDLDSRVNSARSSIGPLRRGDLSWGDFLQLPLFELVPHALELGGEDSALSVGAGAGDDGLDALKEDIADSRGHLVHAFR